MSARPILFEPVADLRTGRVLAYEASTDGTLAEAAAVLAATAAAPAPVHVPVLGRELAGIVDVLFAADPPAGAVLQLAEADAVEDLVTVRRRCARLRTHGFGVAIGGIGDRHASLRLVTEVRPQVVKAGSALVAALGTGSADAAAVTEALAVCSRRIGAVLVASSIGSAEELAAVRALGIEVGQGPLFAAPAGDWVTAVTIPAGEAAPTGAAVRDLLRIAVTAPADASGDTVRDLFRKDESVLTVVLSDDDGRIAGAVHRSRFMIAASGPFGHALNARRSALQHAAPPLLVAPDTPVREAMRGVTARRGTRIHDDLVVAGPGGRCLGIVHVHDLITAAHSDTVGTVLALDALTELPGGELTGRTVAERLAGPDGTAIHWIEARGYRDRLDATGLGGAADLVRALARELRAVAVIVAGSWLGHLGGADFVLLTGREYADLAIRGALGRLPGIEVAVATLDCPPGSGLDADGAIRELAPVRRIAAQATGSSWAVRIAGQQPIRLHAGTAAAAPAAVS